MATTLSFINLSQSNVSFAQVYLSVRSEWSGWSRLTEPWPGYRRQHTADSPAALAPWLIDLRGQEEHHMSESWQDTHVHTDTKVELKDRKKGGWTSTVICDAWQQDTYQTAHLPPLHWASGENVCDKQLQHCQFSKRFTTSHYNISINQTQSNMFELKRKIHPR